MKITLLFIIFVGIALFVGCGDEENEETWLLKPEKSIVNTIGEIKRPEVANVPAAPQMPGTGTPTVTEVNYYSDWQLTKPLKGTAQAGTTIFTEVEFSEAMQHVISDDGNARPILNFVIGETVTQYRMKPHSTASENFQSGDSKPLDNDTDDYICKYTVQEDDEGMFTLQISKDSMDRDGNTLAATYTHGTKLQLGKPATPTVTEISHYGFWKLSNPLVDTVEPGRNIFTKVVFSENVTYTPADDSSALPDIRYVVDGKETQYDIVPRETPGRKWKSGDCKPLEGTKVFVCKYYLRQNAAGEFSVNTGGIAFAGASLKISSNSESPQSQSNDGGQAVNSESPQSQSNDGGQAVVQVSAVDSNYRILTFYGRTTEIELADYLTPGETGVEFTLTSCDASRSDYYNAVRIVSGKLVVESNTVGHVHEQVRRPILFAR